MREEEVWLYERVWLVTWRDWIGLGGRYGQ